MATLILQSAGAAVGTVFGGPIGSVVGRVLGAAGGAAVDGALFGRGSTRIVEGPRLKEVSGLTSTEGEPVPRVYGRARVGGTLVWATRLEEVANTTVERGNTGSKGLSSGAKTVRTTYSYYANLAVGLCEGPIALVRRIWADGTEIDRTALTLRVHTGAEDQEPDPLIVAKEGAESAPAYRGLAYVVFERIALAPFGNRVPQFTFEVVCPVDGLAQQIRAVCLIPGSTEFGLDPTGVTQDRGLGETRPANRFQYQATTDVEASLDALQALCPNVAHVSVVASWFGDDLRAGACTVAPRVDLAAKATLGDTWAVAGLTRESARVVTTGPEGTPAYGGTPSDAGLLRLLAALKARGLKATLYPFVMMDVPAGNSLPDPRTGAPGQPAYPWRGRIACSSALDGSAAAQAEVEAFFGTAAGAGEWTFRRLVLHYATLAAEAELDGFVLGSELVGLTRVQGPAGSYPAVTALRSLAAEVRAILGPGVPLVYAADWTEYGADVRGGGAEVRFPLDPLFADPAIAAVGIDYYPPISDWRDGSGHRDLAEARSGTDPDYLLSRLAAGEAFDWYYADEAARRAQARRPITDGAYGKPWTFRPKDLVSWWSSPHVERRAGVETGPTAWVPGMKPIWLTEIGIPAVDKGPNGPNVFPDPKSSENALPPFSLGRRDPLAQAAGLSAILTRFDPALPGHPAGANPVSGATGARMVDPARVFVWAWDARPYPAFPAFDTVWADAANWRVGHWITGRIEGVPLDRLIAALLAAYGIAAPAGIAVDGFVEGYVLDRPMSLRAALESLSGLFGVDVAVSAGTLRFTGRNRRRTVLALARDDLVVPAQDGDPILSLVRGQESELPRQVEVSFADAESDTYRRATVGSRRLAGGSRREQSLETAGVLCRDAVQDLAEAWLQEAWAARETASFALSPRALALEPGDVVTLPDVAGLHRVARIVDEPGARRIETHGTEPGLRDPAGRSLAPAASSARPPALAGPPAAVVLDLPLVVGDPPVLQGLAVAADPWPGSVAVYRSSGAGAFVLRTVADWSSTLGATLGPLRGGPLWRFDGHSSLTVRFGGGAALASVSDAEALAGANLFAVLGPDGLWEVLSAARAELVAARTWRLSRLLRGLGGSEAQAGRAIPAGCRIVRLDDGAPIPLVTAVEEAGRPWSYRIGPASRDPSDPSFVTLTATAGLSALRPLAPVHLRARRTAEGVRLDWVRRTRVGGDAWEVAEVPLAEEREAYAVDIRGPGGVLRTLAAQTPTLLYPAALEAADFGAAQAVLEVGVAQLGTIAGRGFECRATLTPA